MGSLKSKPKAPPAPAVVYVPQPAPTPVVATPVTTPAPTPEEQVTEARKQSLLTRDRGRFGTILTSFRGLLTQREMTPQRKTLLGE